MVTRPWAVWSPGHDHWNDLHRWTQPGDQFSHKPWVLRVYPDYPPGWSGPVPEKTGSAQDHRLVTIEELNNWIEECEQTGTHTDTFTDDLLFINLEYRWLLESFSEFVKFSCQNVSKLI